MVVRFLIHFDHDDDGAFALDLTPHTLSARWRLGLNNPDDPMAALTRAEIELHDPDGRYQPDSGLLTMGHMLRIQSDDSQTLRTHFMGQVVAISPYTGVRRLRLTLEGPERGLWQHPARIPSMVNARADSAIAAVLDSVPLRRAALSGRSLPDHTDTIINQCAIFPPESMPRQFEAGISRFAWLDQAGLSPQTSAADLLASFAACERGRFYVDREGRARFLNRHHLLSDTTVRAAFIDSAALEMAEGPALVNDLRVRFQPRRIGTANSLLWSASSSLRLDPGQIRLISAPYRDADGNPAGALSLIPLARGEHYRATARADGSGMDESLMVSARVAAAGSASALIELRSRAGYDLYVHDLTLRGTPILNEPPLEIEARDSLSISQHGERRLTLDLPALSDAEDAGRIAAYELLRRADPQLRAVALSTSGHRHPDEVLSLTLFDRIRIEDSLSGHRGEYFIVAEEHVVSQAGFRHELRWLLLPADDDRFLLIDHSSVNSPRVLMPY